MRRITLNQLKLHLENVKKLGITLSEYCKLNELNPSYFSSKKEGLIETSAGTTEEAELAKECINIYDSLKGVQKIEIKEQDNTIEQENLLEMNDEPSKTKLNTLYTVESEPVVYKYEFGGKFKEISSEMMDLICRLYTKRGFNQTKNEMIKTLIELSSTELGCILRSFKITKESLPFAPHVIKDLSAEEIAQLEIDRKPKLIAAQVDKEKAYKTELEYTKLLRKVNSGEHETELVNNMLHSFDWNKIDRITPKPFITSYTHGSHLMLHFADFHIGADVSNMSLYPNPWNEEQLYFRLNQVLTQIEQMNIIYDTIVINLLGDMMDGQDNMTSRRDHFLPQNMDNDEQMRVYNESMLWFVKQLYNKNLCNKLKLYSVHSGNHDGIMYNATTLAIFNALKAIYSETDFIETAEMPNEPFVHYIFEGQNFVLFHGKDHAHMKRPFPLVLNDKTSLFIDQWRKSKGLEGYKINFIKGDLHQESLNVTSDITYRNCLSLFGSSDYSQMNYTPTRVGVSYELFFNGIMSRGIFEVQIN